MVSGFGLFSPYSVFWARKNVLSVSVGRTQTRVGRCRQFIFSAHPISVGIPTHTRFVSDIGEHLFNAGVLAVDHQLAFGQIEDVLKYPHGARVGDRQIVTENVELRSRLEQLRTRVGKENTSRPKLSR